MAEPVKWWFEAAYIQACNCDFGCPCEFQAPPTKGYCEGSGAWQISSGRYGDVSLDGLGLAFAAKWPGALHLGGGTGALFVDERASEAQRAALLQIASGQAGGMPFEIIVTTLSKVLDPFFVPFAFNWDGRNSSVKIGGHMEIETEPVKNPVTGNPEGVRIVHETGFVFKEAEVVAGKTCVASAGEIQFDWPNQSGFVARVRYAN